ncbi:OLC1v1015866C2 [Oldenlandia corymbosa var. corymbosa]|uniref:OLC1v1015866C2 n=1 Tax=Oldenlandia corymbosa var. corymbosa TaxID=529605 RepID=A0AAV1E4Q1_OLDCO|nr:OLC1v1015866C2 [Oldenlandia corymbosa var. corymbosa]
MAPSSASAAKNSSLTNEEEKIRPVAEFPGSIWTDRIKPITLDMQEYVMHAKEIEMLKNEVRNMLIKVREGATIQQLDLIDTIERLGISYHFEEEIEELLEPIFLQCGSNYEEDLQNDLYATALQFRLLRQHGYTISSDIFHQFLNSKGEFQESLINDKKSLLSLYQAAYVRTHEDDILEIALVFATTHLKKSGGDQQEMSFSLAKQVKYALDQPLHRDVPRIQALHYMEVYEEEDGKDPLLLRLAKLDYRYLQILHRKELDALFSWRDDLKNCVPKVTYSRDRLVECYFWGLAAFFEPQYSLNLNILYAESPLQKQHSSFQ